MVDRGNGNNQHGRGRGNLNHGWNNNWNPLPSYYPTNNTNSRSFANQRQHGHGPFNTNRWIGQGNHATQGPNGNSTHYMHQTTNRQQFLNKRWPNVHLRM